MNSTKAAVSTIFARSDEVDWEITASGVTGVSRKVLRYDQETGALTILLKFEAGASYPLHNHLGDEEIYVLEGDVRVEAKTLTVTYYNAPDVDKVREHYENLPANPGTRASTHEFLVSTGLSSTSGFDNVNALPLFQGVPGLVAT